MVLTGLRPQGWIGATCSVSRCFDRCPAANTRDATNYRTAAQQTLTLPGGRPVYLTPPVLPGWT